MLDAFHKVDPSVEGPISVEESVIAQLLVIQNLTEADSGKVFTHRGTSNDWF